MLGLLSSHAQHQTSRRQLVLRRTSEHWYEEEAEFDGVAGELLLPKRLLLVAWDPNDSSISTAAQNTAQCIAQHLAGATLSAGFASPESTEGTAAVWQAVGANGPPFFRKIRTRQMDSSKKLEEFVTELLTQNWRTELDYGLGGADLTPLEYLLVVATQQQLQALLDLLACAVELTSQPTSTVIVNISGWNVGKAASELQPLDSWKSLTMQVYKA